LGIVLLKKMAVEFSLVFVACIFLSQKMVQKNGTISTETCQLNYWLQASMAN
jgi:hypothetical protein